MVQLLHFATKSQSLPGPPFPADLSSVLLGCPRTSSCPSVPSVSSAVSFCLSLSTQPLPLLCLHPFPVSELTSNYTLGIPVLPDVLSYSVFPSVYNYNFAAAKLLQSYPTLCDPIDGSPPGSPSLGFSRREQWSGLPFPSMHESEK